MEPAFVAVMDRADGTIELIVRSEGRDATGRVQQASITLPRAVAVDLAETLATAWASRPTLAPFVQT